MALEPATLWNRDTQNSIFLELYESYTKDEWKSHYFRYDKSKVKLKRMSDRGTANGDIFKFDTYFHDEICRVNHFLMKHMRGLEDDLLTVNNTEKGTRATEKFMRDLLERSVECKKYYNINYFVICKIAAKFEKITTKLSITTAEAKLLKFIQSTDATPAASDGYIDFRNVKFSSHAYIHDVFSDRADQIRDFTKRCMEVYSAKFHVSYPSVMLGKMKFVKEKGKEHGTTKFKIGVKLGLVTMMVSLLIVLFSLS
jgi:SPX domain protein involved in polyphosphate accumulation